MVAGVYLPTRPSVYTARLYDFSRSILVLNRREPAGAQIASLIQKNIGADAVVILDATIPRLYAAGSWTQEGEELARSIFKIQIVTAGVSHQTSFAFEGAASATAASPVSERKVNVSCRYKRTAASV